jgi:hypothetical protein
MAGYYGFGQVKAYYTTYGRCLPEAKLPNIITFGRFKITTTNLAFWQQSEDMERQSYGFSVRRFSGYYGIIVNPGP